MKKALLLSILVVWVFKFECNGQVITRSSINSFGGTTVNGDLKISQSVGQSSLLETVKTEKIKLRQGFQQYDFSSNTSNNSLAIIVYPNPTNKDITISFGDERISEYSYFLYDSQGRVCQFEKKKIAKQINLNSSLSPGVYSIRITAENKTGVTSLIIIP